MANDSSWTAPWSSDETNTSTVPTTTLEYPPADPFIERLQQSLGLGIFGGLAVLINAVPIIIVFVRPDIRANKVNVIVANLAFANLACAATFALGEAVYVAFWGLLPMVGCKLFAFLAYFSAYAEYFLSPILAINRYISLYHNEHYERIYTGKNIALMVILAWMLSTIVPGTFWIGGVTGYDYDNMHCCIIVKADRIGWNIFYWMSIIIPLTFMSGGPVIFCNYKIYKKLWSHANNAKTLKTSNVVQQNKDIFYFLIADTAPPVVIHGIYHLSKILLINRTNPVLKRLFIQLYMAELLIRGSAVLIFLRPFKQAFMDAICCGKKSKVSPTTVGGSSAAPEHTIGSAWASKSASQI